MDINFISSALPEFLKGTLVTLELTILSLVIGLFLAGLLVIGDLANYKFIKWPIRLFVIFTRGTPLLVQIFIMYYGLSQFACVRMSIFWYLLKQPFICALIALTLNTSAYTMVIFRGAISSIPKGEIEACRALGMPFRVILFKIILQRAFRLSLPAYSNEIVMMLQNTSLASTITILDLTGVTKQLISQTYVVIPSFVLAGTIYLLLTAIIVYLFSMMTNKFRNYEAG